MNHSWDFSVGRCSRCKVTAHDFCNLPIGLLEANRCPGVFSCCGGKSGGARWNFHSKQWECKDCGSAQSNDPNYLSSPFAYKPPNYGRITPTTPTGCDHEWVPYTGLKETYEYCKKCDQKKA